MRYGAKYFSDHGGSYRVTKQVCFEEFKAMALSLQSTIIIARHGVKKKAVRVGRYKFMDAMRAILAVLESFGMGRVVYDNNLHEWFQKRQCRRFRFGSPWSWSAGDIHSMVSPLMPHFKDQYAVNFSSVLVLVCEARQTVNRYGQQGVRYLMQHYKSSAVVQNKVSQLRGQLMKMSGMEQCHTIRVFECSRSSVR